MRLDEELVLEYLIENVDLDLNRKYSVKTVLMLDYCYKKNDILPKDVFSGFISKVMNKQMNNFSKSISLDESNLDHCLFLESFKSLSTGKTKDLVKNAKTAQDFKAIIAIDVFSKKVNNYEQVLNSLSSLDSKVFSLVKAYQESNFEKELNKEHMKVKEYFLRVSADLRKPLAKELIGKFSRVKKELDEKLKIYSKYPNMGVALEIQNLVRDSNKAIDNKLGDFVNDINQDYNKIKRIFDDRVWDSGRKINHLISLRSELKDVKGKYQLVLHKEGVRHCNSLDRKIREVIDNYNYVRDEKEEFQGVKRDVSDYYGEVDSIFRGKIDFSSVRRLNSIYSNLRTLSNKEFHDCVSSAWQGDYYSNIEAAMNFIKQRCIKRVNYLTNQSSKYRQKIDGSFFSLRTKKFVGQLEKYNGELEAWSKCRII